MSDNTYYVQYSCKCDVYHFPDDRLEVRSKGLLLTYKVFSKDQRVNHTAIVENKRNVGDRSGVE
jgi:hypothetical protein